MILRGTQGSAYVVARNGFAFRKIARGRVQASRKGDGAFEHLVPLPAQMAVLCTVRRLIGKIDYLFPSIRLMAQTMSENTIGYMCSRNGYSGRHVPHGWHATFSTVMNETAVHAQRPGDRARSLRCWHTNRRGCQGRR